MWAVEPGSRRPEEWLRTRIHNSGGSPPARARLEEARAPPRSRRLAARSLGDAAERASRPRADALGSAKGAPPLSEFPHQHGRRPAAARALPGSAALRSPAPRRPRKRARPPQASRFHGAPAGPGPGHCPGHRRLGVGSRTPALAPGSPAYPGSPRTSPPAARRGGGRRAPRWASPPPTRSRTREGTGR